MLSIFMALLKNMNFTLLIVILFIYQQPSNKHLVPHWNRVLVLKIMSVFAFEVPLLNIVRPNLCRLVAIPFPLHKFPITLEFRINVTLRLSILGSFSFVYLQITCYLFVTNILGAKLIPGTTIIPESKMNLAKTIANKN